jgi:hypothetical protein
MRQLAEHGGREEESPNGHPAAESGGRVRVTLDPAAVMKEMQIEEIYSGHGFHPPLRTLP